MVFVLGEFITGAGDVEGGVSEGLGLGRLQVLDDGKFKTGFAVQVAKALKFLGCGWRRDEVIAEAGDYWNDVRHWY